MLELAGAIIIIAIFFAVKGAMKTGAEALEKETEVMAVGRKLKLADEAQELNTKAEELLAKHNGKLTSTNDILKKLNI